MYWDKSISLNNKILFIKYDSYNYEFYLNEVNFKETKTNSIKFNFYINQYLFQNIEFFYFFEYIYVKKTNEIFVYDYKNKILYKY